MLLPDEHATIMRGVAQRGRALCNFVRAYYEGEDLSGVVPKEMLRAVLGRSGELKLQRRHPLPSMWGFWYGPDLVRGPDGTFFVCEDNIGYVGGMGDLVCARSTLLAAFPEFQNLVDPCDPAEFYRQLAAEYKKFLQPGQVAVLLHYPFPYTADNEEKRVIKIFRELGIIPVALPMGDDHRGRRSRGNTQLVVQEDGVFVDVWPWSHKGRSGRGRGSGSGSKHQPATRHSVGLVVVDGEPFDIDPKHSSVRRKMVMDEAQYWMEYYNETIAKLSKDTRKHKDTSKRLAKIQRERDQLAALMHDRRKQSAVGKFLRRHHRSEFGEVLRQGYPGLLEQYYAGKLPMVNGPGLDFLGDKEFTIHVDNIIRHFCDGEEPILKTIPTLSFRGKSKTQRANDALIDAVFDDAAVQDCVVIKRVDGRGGDGVWVGPKIPRSEFVAVKQKVALEPEAYIVQQYLNLSQLDGHIVDLRNLANVTSDGSVAVSKTPWARGVPLEGNGKVNISDAGFEFAVATAAP